MQTTKENNYLFQYLATVKFFKKILFESAYDMQFFERRLLFKIQIKNILRLPTTKKEKKNIIVQAAKKNMYGILI